MAKRRTKRSAIEAHLPLRGIRVVTLAVNAPGPAAAARLRELGARVVKIEPPDGDLLEKYCPRWYAEMTRGQRVVSLDLKRKEDRASLDRMLANADLLLTAQRLAALDRLGLEWKRLHAKFPDICHVALIGYPAPRENVPGHDLTYQAEVGLLAPPKMPTTLWLDLASAERMVSAAMGLLLARQRTREGAYAEVAIAETARAFAKPLRYGLTARTGMLGGGSARYNVYAASDGWVAVAALEPHFWKRLREALRLRSDEQAQLASVLRSRRARQWERWASVRDLPITAIRQVSGS